MRDEQGRGPGMGLKTERLQVEDADGVARAAELLRAGGTVAFPTETVYGLGANALDAAAVEKIFAAKQRPAWDPLIVHVEGRAMLERVAVVPAGDEGRVVAKLMEAFWPGPLTLLLPRTAAVPDAVTAGRPLVGVRSPAHPVARELIRLAGVPVAAPSANRFGGPVRRRRRMCWPTWMGGSMRCWTAGRRAWGWSRRCWMWQRGRSTGRER